MSVYYVVSHSQGDVIGLYTNIGVKVASYEYDAWGNAHGSTLHKLVSPRQSTTFISTKMSKMLSNNPGAVGKIVNWVRRLFK